MHLQDPVPEGLLLLEWQHRDGVRLRTGGFHCRLVQRVVVGGDHFAAPQRGELEVAEAGNRGSRKRGGDLVLERQPAAEATLQQFGLVERGPQGFQFVRTGATGVPEAGEQIPPRGKPGGDAHPGPEEQGKVTVAGQVSQTLTLSPVVRRQGGERVQPPPAVLHGSVVRGVRRGDGQVDGVRVCEVLAGREETIDDRTPVAPEPATTHTDRVEDHERVRAARPGCQRRSRHVFQDAGKIGHMSIHVRAGRVDEPRRPGRARPLRDRDASERLRPSRRTDGGGVEVSWIVLEGRHPQYGLPVASDAQLPAGGNDRGVVLQILHAAVDDEDMPGYHPLSLAAEVGVVSVQLPRSTGVLLPLEGVEEFEGVLVLSAEPVGVLGGQ